MNAGKGGVAPHVMFFIPSLGGGGTERFTTTLAPALATLGWRVSVLAGKAEGVFTSTLRSQVTVHGLTSGRLPLAVLPAIAHIRRECPDILFGLLNFGAYLGLMKPFLPKRTCVVVRPSTNLDDLIETGLSHPFVPYNELRRRAFLTSLRHVDAIVTQSDAMREEIARLIGRTTDVQRIYNPVTASSSRGDASATAHLTDGPHLVTVGRLSREKGYDLLIAALADLLRTHPRARLTIYGDGAERYALERQARELDVQACVALPGWRDDAMARAASADLFVSSSRFEGLSNAVLEALVQGMRVLVTDCPGGNKEVVRDGENGFVCAAHSSSLIADGIRRALGEVTTLSASEIARDTAMRFGVDEIARQYDEMFDAVIAARRTKTMG